MKFILILYLIFLNCYAKNNYNYNNNLILTLENTYNIKEYYLKENINIYNNEVLIFKDFNSIINEEDFSEKEFNFKVNMDFRFRNIESINILSENLNPDDYKYKDLNIKDKNSSNTLPENEFQILGMYFEINKKF